MYVPQIQSVLWAVRIVIMSQIFPSEQDARNAVRVWTQAKDITVGMLSRFGRGVGSVENDPLSCPRRARFDEASNVIWFIVNRRESENSTTGITGRSLLTFSNGASGDHVAFLGTTSMVDDPARLKAIWDAHADVRFPKGAADPAVTLMKFTPETASYWEGGGDVLGFVVDFVESKITGKPQLAKHGAVPA